MSHPVIQTEQLGKRYRLGGSARLDQTLPEAVASIARRSLGRLAGRPRIEADDPRDLWALRDINLDLHEGEVLGLIGHNGSGKSTLLKILSQITTPTTGRVRIRGRVASLLEVGTGFHPELSGRENIFLNGSILGMPGREIRSKFDEIVAFSGVEKFLDTPVKRYSSGMTVRLAFAVAAHLDPEILVIDEVLAVGDAAFQKKCLGKMEDVAGREGRTVLFVSHNMAAVQSLCTRAVLLQEGRMLMDDTPSAVVDRYLQGQADRALIPLADRDDREGAGGAQLTGCRIACTNSNTSDTAVRIGRPWQIAIDYDNASPGKAYEINVGLFDDKQQRIAILKSTQFANAPTQFGGAGTLTIDLPHGCTLWPGTYTLNLAISGDGTVCDFVRDAARFDVALAEDSGIDATGRQKRATLLLPATFNVTPHMEEPSLATAA